MSSDSRPFGTVAALLLGVVALAHLLRVVFGLEVVVGDYAVPLSVSVVALIVAGALSLLLWRESHG